MKRILVAILAIAMLALSVTAMAEGNNTAPGGMPPAQMQGGPQQIGRAHV